MFENLFLPPVRPTLRDICANIQLKQSAAPLLFGRKQFHTRSSYGLNETKFKKRSI